MTACRRVLPLFAIQPGSRSRRPRPRWKDQWGSKGRDREEMKGETKAMQEELKRQRDEGGTRTRQRQGEGAENARRKIQRNEGKGQVRIERDVVPAGPCTGGGLPTGTIRAVLPVSAR